MRQTLRLPSPALAISVPALVVAVGGGSDAVALDKLRITAMQVANRTKSAL